MSLDLTMRVAFPFGTTRDKGNRALKPPDEADSPLGAWTPGMTGDFGARTTADTMSEAISRGSTLLQNQQPFRITNSSNR